MNKKTTRTNLTPETLEQAVGGSDSSLSIRAEMEAISHKMSNSDKHSEEYNKLASQLENYKSALDGLTSSNQLIMIELNRRMSNSDNCKK